MFGGKQCFLIFYQANLFKDCSSYTDCHEGDGQVRKAPPTGHLWAVCAQRSTQNFVWWDSCSFLRTLTIANESPTAGWNILGTDLCLCACVTFLNASKPTGVVLCVTDHGVICNLFYYFYYSSQHCSTSQFSPRDPYLPVNLLKAPTFSPPSYMFIQAVTVICRSACIPFLNRTPKYQIVYVKVFALIGMFLQKAGWISNLGVRWNLRQSLENIPHPREIGPCIFVTCKFMSENQEFTSSWSCFIYCI